MRSSEAARKGIPYIIQLIAIDKLVRLNLHRPMHQSIPRPAKEVVPSLFQSCTFGAKNHNRV